MNQSERNYITRSSAPLVLNGIRASTLASIRKLLSVNASSHPPIISDLTQRPAKAHQIAVEFYQQLGLDYVPNRQMQLGTRGATSGPPSYADLMGTWIDVEACGDRTTVRSLELATRLIDSITSLSPLQFIVLVPGDGSSWEPENVWFIRFLAQGLKESQHRLLLVSTGPEPSTPANWTVSWTSGPRADPAETATGLLALVPGIVNAEIVSLIGTDGFEPGRHFLTLSNGCLLIAPECRRDPSRVSRFEYDKLAVVADSVKWLKAYAQFYGNNLFVDPAVLVDHALQLISEGSQSLALKFLARAAACTKSSLLRASYESQAQGIRIALHLFKDMAEAPDWSSSIPRELQGALLQAKGWGLVMSDGPARGLEYLQQAGELLKPHYQHSREYLYFMNIHALAKLKTGDISGALALEKEIEGSLDQHTPTDWRLKYVNSINIARLKRKMGEFADAERYYDRAFASTVGVRSESDLIYTNICLARLYSDQGRHEQAFITWLRAGLHWVSSAVPEALGKRVVGAIVAGRELEDSVEESVSGSLFSLILDSIRKARSEPLATAIDDLDLSAKPAPAFVRTDSISNLTSETLSWSLGNQGWNILLSDQEMPPVFTGANSDRLRTLLHTILDAITPALDFPEEKTIAIDNCFGREMPVTYSEMLQACVRLGVPKIVYGTEVYDLGPAYRAQLELETRVRLSVAVERVELNDHNFVVHFKRYLSPKNLSVEESHILASLNETPTITELLERSNLKMSREELLSSLRLLEAARVVELDLSDDAIARAGLMAPQSRCKFIDN